MEPMGALPVRSRAQAALAEGRAALHTEEREVENLENTQSAAKTDDKGFFSCLPCYKKEDAKKPTAEEASKKDGEQVKETAEKSKSLFDTICYCYKKDDAKKPTTEEAAKNKAPSNADADEAKEGEQPANVKKKKKGFFDSIFSCCGKKDDEKKPTADEDSKVSRDSHESAEKPAEPGFLNDVVQGHSFTLATVSYMVHKRNQAMEDATAEKASMGDKVKYYATWALAEATFLAAIPLAAIEAVVRFALSCIVFALKSVACWGDADPKKNTLEKLYNE